MRNAADSDVVEEFFEAYATFGRALKAVQREQALQFRLEAGETVVFNQARMLHGRTAFTEPEPGMRKLRGCYVNIDDFRSRCCARLALSPLTPAKAPNWSFANGSSR